VKNAKLENFKGRKAQWRHHLGSEAVTALSTKMAVVWFVAPCSLIDVYKLSEILASSIA
jgi:hypothetical protein